MENGKRKEAVVVGARLKKLRTELGISQDAMGLLIEITGAAWRQYELGLRIPNDTIKKRISVHFSKSVDELFF